MKSWPVLLLLAFLHIALGGFDADVTITNLSPYELVLEKVKIDGADLTKPVPTSIAANGVGTFSISGDFLRTVSCNTTYKYGKEMIGFDLKLPLLTKSNYCFVSSLRQGYFQGSCNITDGSPAAVGFRVIAAKPPENEFLLFGHAGSPQYFCENTMSGFKDALARGANCIELDISFTQDEITAVWHDWDPDSAQSLARQVGLEGYKCRPWVPDKGDKMRRIVPKLTYAELEQNYGYTEVSFVDEQKCRAECGGDPKCIAKCAPRTADKIPTFDEFISGIAVDKRVKYVFLDTKIPSGTPKDMTYSMMENVYSTMDKYGVVGKAMFSSPYMDVHKDMRQWLLEKKGPEVARQSNYDGQIPPGVVIDPLKFSATIPAIEEKNLFASLGKPVITLEGWEVFEDIIEYDLHRRNVYNIEELRSGDISSQIRYIIWTINLDKDFNAFVPMGLDGLLTDNVTHALDIIDRYF